MKALPVLFFLALLVMQVPAAAQDDETETPQLCVSTWFYPSADYPGAYDSVMDNTDLIDEVNPFWYNPLPDGSLQPTPEAENADQLAAWREAGLKIVPSIFSSNAAVIRDDLRETHVEAIIDLVVSMDYDGIDIDYEGFPADSREDFSLFAEALSEAMAEIDRELSITVHAKTYDPGPWEGAAAQDWERLSVVADVFRVMTYDYTSRNEPPGPIAPIPWVLDVLAYAESVVDMGKVRMGVHFYGYSWQRGTPPSITVTWSSIQNWVENLGVEILRDPESMEAYMDFKAPGLPRQTIYIADAEGLAAKLDAVLADYPALGGVSIWGIGGEHPGMWDTLRAVTMGCGTNTPPGGA
jgi:spore germination protein YaaH